MLQANWTTDGVELVDHEPSPPAEGWTRLSVTGCGICGSDLHIYRGMRSGVLSPTDFAVPGHEIAGTVVDGPSGTADTVYAVEPWFNCQTCPECVQGATILCEDSRLLGISGAGGLSELVDVPTRLLHPVPEQVGPALASLAEPWAVAVRAVHRARQIQIGERVLVLGGGTIGLLCGLAARDRAATVGITCRYPHQADLARRFGLTPLEAGELAPWSDEHRPGIVIETVGGEADTMTEAVRHARPGSRIVVVGVFGPLQPTDYRTVVVKELEIVGSIYYGTVGTGSEFGAAVATMGGVVTELAMLQTHRFALADVREAFATADDKSSLAVKVTITPTAG